MLETRISQEGWVLIPAKLRRSLGLRPDKPLQIYAVGGELRILPRLQGMRQAQAIAARFNEFIAEKRGETARE